VKVSRLTVAERLQLIDMIRPLVEADTSPAVTEWLGDLILLLTPVTEAELDAMLSRAIADNKLSGPGAGSA